MKFYILALASFMIPLISPAASHAARMQACVTSDSKVVVKRRCKSARGESQLDLSQLTISLSGLKGDKGDKGDIGNPGAAGPQGASATKLFGQVAANGSLLRGTGITNSTTTFGGYIVTFTQNVANCTQIVSQYEDTVDSGFDAQRHFTSFAVGNQVAVIPRDLSGSFIVGAFQIAVFCP